MVTPTKNRNGTVGVASVVSRVQKICACVCVFVFVFLHLVRTFRGHVGLVKENPAEVVLVGENFGLLR